MPFSIAPGPFGQDCSAMAYTPRTSPGFRTDRHHDVRDHLLDQRLPTLRLWGQAAGDAYLAAARLMGVHDDPVALCLRADDVWDARTLRVAHDLLAAHWRHAHLPARLEPGPIDLEGGSGSFVTYRGLRNGFQRWLLDETRAWCLGHPEIVRLICLVMVQDHTRTGQLSEAHLFVALRRLYPIPGDA